MIITAVAISETITGIVNTEDSEAAMDLEAEGVAAEAILVPTGATTVVSRP